MRKLLVKILAHLMGYQLIEPLFLIRMRSIEKHLKTAVKNYSFILLDSAYDRLLWEYQFAHEKIEMDMICELLKMHEQCKEVIKQNLAAECGVNY